MFKIFLFHLAVLFLSFAFHLQARAETALIPEERTNFFKSMAKARTEALEVREKYFCLDSKSKKYVQGTITLFDGVENGTAESWTVIHRITGCQLKRLNVSKPTLWSLNFLWEGYELFGAGELTNHYFKHRPRPRIEAAKAAFQDYWQDTKKDTQAILEGYNTDGAQCATRFIPSACLSEDQLQRQGVNRDRVVHQKIWSAKDDPVTHRLQALANTLPQLNKKEYSTLGTALRRLSTPRRSTR